MIKFSKKNSFGFTLVEMIVSVAVFALMAVSAYQIISSVLSGSRYTQNEAAIASLADQYIEIARNLPYSQVGTMAGNPHGTLPDLPNALYATSSGRGYKVYYAVSYVDDPADGTIVAGTDFAPNDYKQVKLYITDTKNGMTNSFQTNIAPRSLENIAAGGALFIKVFNAVGQPVPGAAIHITNTSVTPNINLTRLSDTNGNWVEVGLPNSANSYHIVVTKNGYSTDQTYPISGSNPNPTKPDATILNGQVTQVSFAIDLLSNLTFNTLSQTCSPLSGVDLEVQGSKLIGTPDILKFDNTYTSNSSGQIPLNNIEWDTYTPILLETNYEIYGTSPILQTNILPGTSQTFTFILGPVTANSLLVIVKDNPTANPIEGASVELQESTPPYDATKITGGSIWSQQDWTGGSGQANFVDNTKYYRDDGNIKNTGQPAGLRLKKIGSKYANSGSVISSTFDTGTSQTNYTTITWQPTSQDSNTSIKFQIATNNDNATWNFIGPDGTAGSYYTVPGTSISAADNNRYIRYKVILESSNGAKTPVLTSLNINYVSGCFTPGQVIFSDIADDTNYTVTVSMDGYQTQTINGLHVSGNSTLQVMLGH